MPRITRRATLASAAAALAAPALARAQARFPDRPITIVAPFPPGGQADLAARPVAATLQKLLGQPVVVQNRAGAGGAIGHAAVAKSAPDGYTLLMALPSFVFLPESMRIRGQPPSYEVEELAPIARVLADPMLLGVPTGKWNSAAEFVADAKRRPDQISYSSSGIYGTLHIATEMMAAGVGLKFLHVPFTGAGPALSAFVAGTVDFIAATPGVLKPAIDAGRMKVLANWGARRHKDFADAPTWMEQGFGAVEYYNWAGLFGPAATPQPVQAILRDAMQKAMADPETIRIFEGAGAEPAFQNADDFAAFVRADTARLVNVIRTIGRID